MKHNQGFKDIIFLQMPTYVLTVVQLQDKASLMYHDQAKGLSE